MKILMTLVFLVLIGSVAWHEENKYEEYDDCSPSCRVYVQRVIDGDTFVTSSGMRIRISGYNAPELGNIGGQEAKDCLVSLILNKFISIDLQTRDVYGRQVASVRSHKVTC